MQQHSPKRTPEPCATLTIEEAREFEMLDALPPFDDYGKRRLDLRRGANDPPRKALVAALHEAERGIAYQSTEHRVLPSE